MFWIFFTYFFLLGIIIGSFLNVVILRHNTGRTAGGRSGCMTCGHALSVRELVPILSYVAQRGRCVHCRSHVSPQYPLVELATALLFAGNFVLIYALTQSLFEFAVLYTLSSTILALLVVIFVYDLIHFIIPDKFSYSLGILSILYTSVSILFFKTSPFWIGEIGFNLTTLLNVIAGIIFYLFVYVLWKVSKGTWIGLGDAKLLFGIGTTLGIVYGLSAFFLSFWIGALYAVVVMLVQRLSRSSNHITMKSEIAFGPFLIIGFMIVYFFKIDVTNLSFMLQNFL